MSGLGAILLVIVVFAAIIFAAVAIADWGRTRAYVEDKAIDAAAAGLNATEKVAEKLKAAGRGVSSLAERVKRRAAERRL